MSSGTRTNYSPQAFFARSPSVPPPPSALDFSNVLFSFLSVQQRARLLYQNKVQKDFEMDASRQSIGSDVVSDFATDKPSDSLLGHAPGRYKRSRILTKQGLTAAAFHLGIWCLYTIIFALFGYKWSQRGPDFAYGPGTAYCKYLFVSHIIRRGTVANSLTLPLIRSTCQRGHQV